MNTLNKIDKFSLKINKASFNQFINYFKDINESESLSNIRNHRSRFLNINEKDMFFLIEFLIFEGYCIKKSEMILIQKMKDNDKLFNEFRNYFIDQISLDKELKKEIFDLSKFEIIDDNIYIDVNSIKINYRQIFGSLQKLESIKDQEDNKKIVCNFKLAEILMYRPLKKISQKDFDILQKNKKIKGEKAELFVMNSEKKKLKLLNLHPSRVSIENINLGYDIESYDLNSNKIYIEVKAIDLNDKIYWTENEINKSKILKNNYFLYCVRFKNSVPEKIYKIIQNPYKEILSNSKYNYTIETKTTYIVNLY